MVVAKADQSDPATKATAETTSSTATATATATTTAQSGAMPRCTYPKHPEIPPEEWERLHPVDEVDHRPDGGPLLTLLWSKGEPLTGQTLYLGGEVGVDGKIYCIPGHAPKVLLIDPDTDEIRPIGPNLSSNGTKYKWLRGIPVGDIIYGLPCHASEVLRIHVPTRTISKLPIPYEEHYADDPQEAKTQREMIWKYHGGNISPIDGCIYAIPQAAGHVLKLDPVTETCSLVGPKIDGKCKWYGGVVGAADGAIYGIPHNHGSVLRITPDSVTLHGDYGSGGHKWHGAAAAANGVIVCVPANSGTVLCVCPADPEPTLVEIRNDEAIRTGRHRSDEKYKYLGAMAGTNGRVYVFPSGSEYVLEVDAERMTARNVGPNLLDAGMERVCQNKWQNGLTCAVDQSVYAMPLAGETILQIDCSDGGHAGGDGDGAVDGDVDGEPVVTAWNLPSPCQGRDKWEGGVILDSGIMYTVPNNHKAVLRIEPSRVSKIRGSLEKGEDDVATAGKENENADNSTVNINPVATKRKKDKKGYVGSREEYGGDNDDLVYKSGIPTLRSSAHRVKFSPKSRLHDPKPVDQNGNETGTTWLPTQLLSEDIFDFDMTKYNLRNAIAGLLQSCDPTKVGTFKLPGLCLEDFQVPTASVWRSVNGGQCEESQKYLSDCVSSNTQFLELFDKFVQEVAIPHLKRRLVATGSMDVSAVTKFYYQRPPTLRLQPGPGWAKVKPHNDAEYGHQNGELNFWIPLTDRGLTGVDLWSESEFKADDYHPIPATVGQAISFHGSSCRHYVNANSTSCTRVSLDFRVGVGGYFDPYWQMQGTTDDHGRKEFVL